jgi:hypothetical protein
VGLIDKSTEGDYALLRRTGKGGIKRKSSNIRSGEIEIGFRLGDVRVRSLVAIAFLSTSASDLDLL